MTTNRKLVDLRNIGPKIAGRLNEVGIFSEEKLRFYGAIETHKMIKQNHPNETLPVFYYLYSFEGALCNKHWNEIGEEKKKKLKQGIVS